METLKKFDTLGLIIILSLLTLDGFIWFAIFRERASPGPSDYFLDVGQGDGELVMFDGNIKVMTDAGPDGKVRDSLEKVMPVGDRYVDIAIVSHPQLDHFNGYAYLLDVGYRFGVFIYNGRADDPGVKAWPELLQKIRSKNIPLLTLGKGDSIHSGENEIDLLSPDKDFAQSAELNDTAFVELVKTPSMKTLLTADTGFNVEELLLARGMDIRADVLKVGHHGSKYSSEDAFLRAVDPKIAVIEVGAKNVYGHPAKETLARIVSSTRALILRTDRDGTVEIFSEGGKLKAIKEKQ
jgi:competence protein ComEC